jgi:hypothetical protein
MLNFESIRYSISAVACSLKCSGGQAE